jgi:hypothetical protein
VSDDANKILDAYRSGKPRPKLVASAPDARPQLMLHPAKLPNPKQIKPRQWLYGTQLVRGYVTVLVAPGGTGKSAYAMGMVLSIVADKPFLGEHVFRRVNGAIFNLEDPMDELNRRLAALMMRHRVSNEDVAGRFFLDDGEDRGLTMAALDEEGFNVVHPDEDALIAEIQGHDIGIVVCDPFAESHTLEENSNPQMVKAAAAWRRVARVTSCSVLLVHHVRKGDATGIDAARGAKALTDSARVGLLLSTMSERDGEAFGVDADDRWQYVRLDDAKRNMAPAAKAKWFKLDQVELGNTDDPVYPHGDKVAAIIPWEPTNVWQATPVADLNAAIDTIRDGPSPGVLFTATRRGSSSARWAGNVLCKEFAVTESQAGQMIAAWLKDGLLWEDTYYHSEFRRQVKGVRVNENKRPGWINV